MTAYPLNFAGHSLQVAAPVTPASVRTLPAIAASGISMQFQHRADVTQILSGVDLEVKNGQIQLLMGPSGSGKTTLLSILAGILTPTAGQVHLLGKNITNLSKSQLAQFRLHNLGFIFQGFNLFPALTAIENVEVTLNTKGIRGKVAKQQAQHLLEQTGMADKANQKPRDLSGGQQQRVAIARALAGDPKLILADEPTASLDSKNGHAVIEMLRHLAKEQGRTVLMVTHDPRIIDVADEIIYLEDGSIRARPPLTGEIVTGDFSQSRAAIDNTKVIPFSHLRPSC
jgi:putative ABC transport system ATP-binding protein